MSNTNELSQKVAKKLCDTFLKGKDHHKVLKYCEGVLPFLSQLIEDKVDFKQLIAVKIQFYTFALENNFLELITEEQSPSDQLFAQEFEIDDELLSELAIEIVRFKISEMQNLLKESDDMPGLYENYIQKQTHYLKFFLNQRLSKKYDAGELTIKDILCECPELIFRIPARI